MKTIDAVIENFLRNVDKSSSLFTVLLKIEDLFEDAKKFLKMKSSLFFWDAKRFLEMKKILLSILKIEKTNRLKTERINRLNNDSLNFLRLIADLFSIASTRANLISVKMFINRSALITYFWFTFIFSSFSDINRIVLFLSFLNFSSSFIKSLKLYYWFVINIKFLLRIVNFFFCVFLKLSNWRLSSIIEYRRVFFLFEILIISSKLSLFVLISLLKLKLFENMFLRFLAEILTTWKNQTLKITKFVEKNLKSFMFKCFAK